MTPQASVWGKAWVTALVAMACSGSAAVDKDTAIGASADTGLCADTPLVTWENFGDGFVRQNCQTCHSSTSTDRRGAPPNATFDSHDQTVALRDRILARATGDDPTMPPSGGVAPLDRTKLEIWLTCWESR
jgi:cytochrome c5